jgi:hypothetical protein
MYPGIRNEGEAGVHGSRLSRLKALGRDDNRRGCKRATRWTRGTVMRLISAQSVRAKGPPLQKIEEANQEVLRRMLAGEPTYIGAP